MKKLFTFLLTPLLFLLSQGSQAQIQENFSTSQVLSSITCFPDNVTKLVENNSLAMIVNKDSLFAAMLYSFSVTELSRDNSKVSFEFKSNHDLVIRATLLDEDSNAIAIAPNQNIYASKSFNSYSFDLSDTTWKKIVELDPEIQVGNRSKVKFFVFSVTKPVASLVNDTLILSNLKVGSNVNLPAKITSYSNDFSSSTLANEWVSERNAMVRNNLSYNLSQEGGALKIDALKTGFNGLWFYPQNTLLDISKRPMMSLKAKATRNLSFTVWLWGNNNLYTFTGITFNIKASEEFRTYYFDFTDLLKVNDNIFIDPSAVKGILIAFEGGMNYRGVVTFDDIKIGDAAEEQINKAPTIDANQEITVFNTEDEQSFAITGISTGSPEENQKLTIEVSEYNTDLLFAVSVSYVASANTAQLVIFAQEGMVGESEIKLTLTDDGGTRNGGKNKTEAVVKVKLVNPVALDKATTNNGFQIFPNPIENVVNIKSVLPHQEITISDLNGKKILSQETNSLNTKLDTEAIVKGLYFLQIKQGDKIYQTKLVK